jgi:hypothetical protein
MHPDEIRHYRILSRQMVDRISSRTYVRGMGGTVLEWALMCECAEHLLEQARAWWPDANGPAQERLTPLLAKLSTGLATNRDERLPRPTGQMDQEALMWACWRAAEGIRVHVQRDDCATLWDAAAKLAFASATVKAAVLADMKYQPSAEPGGRRRRR